MSRTSAAVPTPAYVHDIHAQPQALQRFLDAGLGGDARDVLARVDDFDRIVMTGMGASLFAQYPGFLTLAQAGKPVWIQETAELLGPARGLLTPRTLLWVTSQSGGTAEVEELMSDLRPRPAAVIGVTNDPSSPLGRSADAVIELHCGVEQTVGTRSYVNTLAATAAATGHALGEQVAVDLAAAPAALAAYLEDWTTQHRALDERVPDSTTYILGRGPSLAAAMGGALVLKEAAGRAIEGMSVPQFRHGPLEMVGPHVTVVLLAGGPAYDKLNRAMAADLARFGARVVWVDAGPVADGVTMPDLSSAWTRPLAEILPLQVLSVVLAERAGHLPGSFSKIAKVTRTL